MAGVRGRVQALEHGASASEYSASGRTTSTPLPAGLVQRARQQFGGDAPARGRTSRSAHTALDDTAEEVPP